MKQFLFAIFALLIGLSLTIGTYAQEKEKVEKKEIIKEVQKEVTTSAEQTVEKGKPVNSICPVSGEEIDQNITYTYNGKTYALCCNKCLKKFKADPEKYISKMKTDEKPAVQPEQEQKK